jgi:hypothetical protein
MFRRFAEDGESPWAEERGFRNTQYSIEYVSCSNVRQYENDEQFIDRDPEDTGVFLFLLEEQFRPATVHRRNCHSPDAPCQRPIENGPPQAQQAAVSLIGGRSLIRRLSNGTVSNTMQVKQTDSDTWINPGMRRLRIKNVG